MARAIWNWQNHITDQDRARLASLIQERNELDDRIATIRVEEDRIIQAWTKRAKAAGDKFVPLKL